MSFKYDGTGVTMSQYKLLPDGWAPFKIVEAEERTSKNGDFQVLAKCKCVDPRYQDCSEVWNYVTFLPKEKPGAGIPLHFLKCIGQPHEGEIQVDADKWLGKKFLGNVITDEYQGKKNNKLKEISPWRDMDASMEEQPPAAKVDEAADEEIPF